MAASLPFASLAPLRALCNLQHAATVHVLHQLLARHIATSCTSSTSSPDSQLVLPAHSSPSLTAPCFANSLLPPVVTAVSPSVGCRSFFSVPSSTPQSHKYNQRRLVGWSPEQFYSVVSKVEDYQQFVPWCRKSRIMKRHSDKFFEAELEVGFQLLVERYVSQVHLEPTRLVRSEVHNSTLFDHLDSSWLMEKGPTPRSCWLTFNVDFAFRSALHGYLADIFFSEVVKQMVGAFEGRCAQQYGHSSLFKPSHPRTKTDHDANPVPAKSA